MNKSLAAKEALPPRPEHDDEDPELEQHPELGVKTTEELLDLAEQEGWDESELEEKMQDFSQWEGDQPPTAREIEDESWLMQKRWHDLRLVAQELSQDLVVLPEVRKVVLLGSAARPLKKEVPRFAKFRQNQVAIWHECADLDLAVWFDRLQNLNLVRKMIGKVLLRLRQSHGISMAPHQVEMFIFEPATDRMLGHLCHFNQCPKGKLECFVPRCGQPPFVRQFAGFELDPDALAPAKTQTLFERQA